MGAPCIHVHAGASMRIFQIPDVALMTDDFQARLGAVGASQGPLLEEARETLRPRLRRAPERASSVRPGPGLAREGSMYMDERASVRREYLPVDHHAQPRFRVVEQDPQPHHQMQMQPRYVDEHGREVVRAPQDDGAVRYVQRY